jgi:hypothetical protein
MPKPAIAGFEPMMDPEIPPPPDPDASEEERRKADDLFLARQGRRAARVPRRFGVGVLLLFVLLYALLFSFLSVLGVPPLVFLLVAIYVTAIGLGQILLFGGEKPREASIWVGVAVFLLMCTMGCLADLLGHFSLVAMLQITCISAMVLTLAVPVSYVTGCAMAGVFLLIDRLRTGVWNPDPDPNRLLPPPPSPPDQAPPNGSPSPAA